MLRRQVKILKDGIWLQQGWLAGTGASLAAVDTLTWLQAAVLMGIPESMSVCNGRRIARETSIYSLFLQLKRTLSRWIAGVLLHPWERTEQTGPTDQ